MTGIAQQIRNAVPQGCRIVYVSDRMFRAYQRQVYDNMRVDDGPFRYVRPAEDGTSFPRLVCCGVEVRVRKGLRRPVPG